MSKGCDPNWLANQKKAMEEAGFAKNDIKIALDIMAKGTIERGAFAKAVSSVVEAETFSEGEQSELDNLNFKIWAKLGDNKNRKNMVEALDSDDYSRFKFLQMKKQAAETKTRGITMKPRKKTLGYKEALEAQIAKYEQTRPNKAKRIKKAVDDMVRTGQVNSNLNNSFKKVNNLFRDKEKLKELWLFTNQQINLANPKYKSYITDKKEIMGRKSQVNKELNDLSKRIDKLQAKLESLIEGGQNSPSATKKINETLAKIAELKDKADKLNIQLLKEDGLLDKIWDELKRSEEKNPATRNLVDIRKAIGKEIKKIDYEMTSAGFVHEGFIQHILDTDTSATLRGMTEDMKLAKADADAREKLYKTYFEEKEEVSTITIQQTLGQTFVEQRAEGKDFLTEEEVDKIFKEWKGINFQYAGTQGILLADIEFATSETLQAMADAAQANSESNIDQTNNDTLIIPILTMREVIEKSNPGTIPEENRGITPQETYNKLAQVLRKLATLRSMPGYGKHISSARIQKIFADITGIDDVNPLILFSDDIVSMDRQAPELDADNRVSLLRKSMEMLGYTPEQIETMPELQNYSEWLQDDKAVSIDIETSLEDDNNTILVVSVVGTNGKRVKYELNKDGITQESAAEILQLLEDSQNDGIKVVTYNGNGFDLVKLGNVAKNPNQAARIALRSIDLMQNFAHMDAHQGSAVTTFAPKLDNIAKAMGMKGKTDKGGGLLTSLWALRASDENYTVTKEDFQKRGLDRAGYDMEEVLKDINALSSVEAKKKIKEYAEQDAALNLNIIYGQRQENGSSVAGLRQYGDEGTTEFPQPVTNASNQKVNFDIKPYAPTWNITGSSTSRYALNKGMETFLLVPSVNETLGNATEQFGTDWEANQMVDIDGATQTLLNLMARAKHADPETRLFATELVKMAQEAATPQQKLLAEEIERLERHQNALTDIVAENIKTDQENNRHYPLRFEAEGQISFASDSAEGTETDYKQQYIDTTVLGLLEYLKFTNQSLDSAAKKINFRDRNNDEQQADYAIAMMEHVYNTYTPNENINLFDLGNGKVDYAPAFSVGIGIGQLIFNQREGFIPRPHDAQMREEGYKFAKTAKNEQEKHNRSMFFRTPYHQDVNQALPRSLAEVDRAFNDFRRRERIKHILGYDIKSNEEALAILKGYTNRTESPDEVLSEGGTPVPELVPNTSNAMLLNRMPSLEERRRMALESMLDMPSILMAWNHDASTHGLGQRVYLDPQKTPTFFERAEESAGGPTGSTLLSGMGPQLAHSMLYPVITTDLIRESLDRGIAAAKEFGDGVWDVGNYFDFKFNGVHHMAALLLQYSDGAERLNTLLEENGVVVYEPKDIYNETQKNLLAAIDRRIALEPSETLKSQLEEIKTFLNTDSEARDAMKLAVIPRLYSSGLPGVLEGMRTWQNETNSDVNVEVLAEMMFHIDTVFKMSALDKSMGGLGEDARASISEGLESALNQVYGGGGRYHTTMQTYMKNNFRTGKNAFGLEDLRFAINERIDYMTDELTPKKADDGLSYSERKIKTRQTIRDEFQGRIDKAQKEIDKMGGTISNPEDMRKIHIILSGDEFGYKNQSTLASLNVANRTPFSMDPNRPVNADGMEQTLREAHMGITGRYIDREDMLGFEDYSLYFTHALDDSGQRMYAARNWAIQPQNSSLSQIARTGTEKDDNPYGLWELKYNNLSNAENPELEVNKLMARQIAIESSSSYAPTNMDYDMASVETESNFWNAVQKRSELEDDFYVQNLSDEVNNLLRLEPAERSEATKKLIKLRKSNATLLKDSVRWLLDPTRSKASDSESRYIPSANATIKGLGAFRPDLANIPWSEKGIMSLAIAQRNRQMEIANGGRITKDALADNPTKAEDIIPKDSRGWANPYKGSDAAYVPESPVDFIKQSLVGSDSSKRIAKRAEALKPVLQRFAVDKGLDHLLEDGKENWSQLYVHWLVHRKTVQPYLKKLRKLDTSDRLNGAKDTGLAIQSRFDMLSDLTKLYQFHNDVSEGKQSLVEFGQMIGFTASELSKDGEAVRYVDFLRMMAQRGVDSLAPLVVGQNNDGSINLVQESNLIYSGQTNERIETRIGTLTVQNGDSFEVLYTLLYNSRGMQLATKYFKDKVKNGEMTVDEMNALEKDPNGNVLISSIPLDDQTKMLDVILADEKLMRFAIKNMGLYITLDSYQGNARLGFDQNRDTKVQTDYNAKDRPNMGRGSKPEMMSTHGGRRYLNSTMIQQMFNSLRNDVLWQRAHLASATNSEFGVQESSSMRIQDAASRKFYEAQRDGYAEEMDVLAYLHDESSVRPVRTNNPKLSDEYGFPLDVYDAQYYLTNVDPVTKATAHEEAYNGFIRSARENAKVLGLKAEEDVLSKMLDRNRQEDFRLNVAVIIVAETAHGRADAITKLQAHLPGSTSRTEVEKIFNSIHAPIGEENISRIEAYRIASTRTRERNKFIGLARRYVEVNGAVENVLNDPNALAYLGVDTSNKEQVIMARSALRNANESIKEVDVQDNMWGGTGSDIDFAGILGTYGFIQKYGDKGTEISGQIDALVQNGTISEPTANLYRGLMATIMSHDNNFFDNVSLSTSDNIRKASEVTKLGEKYSIKINPSVFGAIDSPEAFRVFAHEIVHIAQLKYMSIDSPAWNAIQQSLSSADGKAALKDIMLSMGAKDSETFDADFAYYSSNPYEFMAEFGSYFLMAKVLNNKSVMSDLNTVRTKHETADKMMSWWERAFSSIKNFGNRLLTKMSLVKQTHPETYNLMEKSVDTLFNFDMRADVTGRPVVHNPNMRLGVALTADISPGVDLTTTASIQVVSALASEKKALMMEAQAGNVLTPEKTLRLEELEMELSEYQEVDHLGLSHEEFSLLISGMTEEDGSLREPYSRQEEVAKVSLVLRRVGKQRGTRVDSPGTVAGMIRRIFGNDNLMIDKIQRMMYTNSNQSDKTWNSHVAILASLSYLLDTTKATTENVFVMSGEGILHNKNYTEQMTRAVTQAVGSIRGNFKNAKEIEVAAFNILLNKSQGVISEKPEQMDNDEWNAAKSLSDTYLESHTQFIRMAKEAGIRSERLTDDPSGLVFRLNKEWLQDKNNLERESEFRSALVTLQSEKLNNSLNDDGMGTVDPILLYMSDVVPEVGNTSDFVAALEETNSPRRLMLKAIAPQARQIFLSEDSTRNQTSWDLIESDPGQAGVRASYYEKAVLGIIKKTSNQKLDYNTMLSGLQPQEKQIIMEYLRGQTTRESATASRRYEQITNSRDKRLSSLLRLKDIRSNLQRNRNMLMSPAHIKADYFLAQVGNSTFAPYLEKTNDIQIKDIFLNDRPEFDILKQGFATDFKHLIKGTQIGLGGSAYVRKTIADITGVKNVTFHQLIDTLQGLLDDPVYGRSMNGEDLIGPNNTRDQRDVLEKGFKILKRVHDVGMHVGERFETSGRSPFDWVAQYGPDILTLTWGPNLNSANMIFEGTIGGLTTAMYGGNPLSLFANILGNSAKMMWNMKGGMNRMSYEGSLRAFGDAVFDTDSSIRDLLDNRVADQMDDMNQQSKKAQWLQGIRNYQNITALAIRISLMKEGSKLLLKNASYLKPMAEWLANVDRSEVSADMRQYDKMLKEAGPGGFRNVLGFGLRPEVAKLMQESDLLNLKNINMLQWVMSQEDSLMKSGTIDLVALKSKIAQDPNGIVEFNGQQFKMTDLYTLGSKLEQFHNKYAELAITKSDALDRDVDKGTAWYLQALYRSFPHLYTMQHVMRAGATQGYGPYFVKMASAAAMDLLYNFFLMSLWGGFSDEDIERWSNGDWEGQDAVMLVNTIGRNPIFGIRGTMAIEAVTSLLYGMVGDKGTQGTLKMLQYAVLPLAAGIKMGRDLADTVNHGVSAMTESDIKKQQYDQEMAARSAMMFARRFFPILNDSIFTAVINQAYPEPTRPSTKRRRGGGNPISAYAYNYYQDQQEGNTAEEVYRGVIQDLNKEIPHMMAERNKRVEELEAFTPDYLPDLPSEPQESAPKPSAPETPSAPTTPQPAVRNDSMASDRATTPITPPEGLQ